MSAIILLHSVGLPYQSFESKDLKLVCDSFLNTGFAYDMYGFTFPQTSLKI